MRKIIDAAKKAKITAIIASDISAIEYANKKKMEVHISVQANVSNIEAVKFYSKYSDVIVLARELTLEQIKYIIDEIKKQKITGPSEKLIEIEIFAHGTLCVSISGKCYMSLAAYNSSANRGSCFQNCRRTYKVIDEETGDELVIGNKYVMSPKDLCTIGFLDKILDAGVSILKLEGRGRAPDYVATVTKCYKEAIISHKNKTYSKQKIKNWMKELKTVYNRGFWEGGYYLGKKLGDWSGTYGSKATKEKIQVGKVNNYYKKSKIAEIKIETREIKQRDELLITGSTTGVEKEKIKEIWLDNKKVKSAGKSKIITIKFNKLLRKSDKVFVLKKIKNEN